ncbi:MAG TPA: CocE/NonD family hydrolase [Blastocatellia bacterium]|nr:CocE/NonD family hydrolase [Blastocatellia bacterium]
MKRMRILARLFVIVALFNLTSRAFSQTPSADEVKASYTKTEVQIRMRDGVKLFTAIYTPKDQSQKYPILMQRTPYSVAPYGADQYKTSLGPSPLFQKEGYIFVYQDVRGRMMSEGDFKMMTPYKAKKSGPTDVDESTDTWDTIDWLIKNVPNNNGRVGVWGISFPGHYAAQTLIDAHPALRAVSPQAPMADNYMGDDLHHNGAFCLQDGFNFSSFFGQPRTGPTTADPTFFDPGTPDGYKFFLQLGALANANARYFHNRIRIWDEWMRHGDYDDYWQAQNVPKNLTHVKPSVAVMIVGGWFDAEDLQGPLKIYEAIEKHNPKTYNTLVMGPWFHGGWARSDGEHLGNVHFSSKTSEFYRENIELPFFNYYLKDKGELKQPEAYVFNTGANKWWRLAEWPPKNVEAKSYYLDAGSRLPGTAPAASGCFAEYVSDPARPVPFVSYTTIDTPREYMTDDQRFAATRPDVLVFQTESLAAEMTVAGPVHVSLDVSTTGTDADFVVKVIDVYPNDAPDNEPNPAGVRMGGYQMLVRGEPFRAKYRHSFVKPEALVPGKMTRIEFDMPDIFHTWLKGHRLMVQVQSSWFPFVDRNPQRFEDIYSAKDSDFQKATQRVYCSSHITLRVMKPTEAGK